eukprot:scaffold90756_cov63-Phaeocystis_antarctica.AAC.4
MGGVRVATAQLAAAPDPVDCAGLGRRLYRDLSLGPLWNLCWGAGGASTARGARRGLCGAYGRAAGAGRRPGPVRVARRYSGARLAPEAQLLAPLALEARRLILPAHYLPTYPPPTYLPSHPPTRLPTYAPSLPVPTCRHAHMPTLTYPT